MILCILIMSLNKIFSVKINRNYAVNVQLQEFIALLRVSTLGPIAPGTVTIPLLLPTLP